MEHGPEPVRGSPELVEQTLLAEEVMRGSQHRAGHGKKYGAAGALRFRPEWGAGCRATGPDLEDTKPSANSKCGTRITLEGRGVRVGGGPEGAEPEEDRRGADMA